MSSWLPVRDLRQHHGGLVRLGADVGEEALRSSLPGRDARELLRQLDDRHRRVERRDVAEPLDLRVDARRSPSSLQWPTETVRMPPKKSRYSGRRGP